MCITRSHAVKRPQSPSLACMQGLHDHAIASCLLSPAQQNLVRSEMERLAEEHGSMRALSRVLGLTSGQVSDLIGGRRTAGEKTVQALAGLLGEDFTDRLAALADTSADSPAGRPPVPGATSGTYVEKEDRYHFARDVAQRLVEDGFVEDPREAARLVGEVVFYEGTQGVTAEDLYRAVVRHINRQRKPWKTGIGERVLTGNDEGKE